MSPGLTSNFRPPTAGVRGGGGRDSGASPLFTRVSFLSAFRSFSEEQLLENFSVSLVVGAGVDPPTPTHPNTVTHTHPCCLCGFTRELPFAQKRSILAWSAPPCALMDDEFLSNLPAEALSPNSTEVPGPWSSADGAETVHFVVRCVMTSVYILIIVVGLLGNITLVKIFITNSAMRSVPNIFISSLAAGDLLLLVTCVPVDAFRYFSEEWVFGEAACKLIPVIQLTSVGVSVFTLTALSADR